ncbi:MAG: hypothetical protein ACYDCK_15500, partial [Thermoplasmatota archaeon]
FLSVFASTFQHGTVALRWSLADGAKSATQPAANAVLQAGGSASGPVSIAADASDPFLQPASLASEPPNSPSAVGMFAEFDPGASGVYAHAR